jgi:hypothetical protein
MLRGSFWIPNGEARFRVIRGGIMLREAFFDVFRDIELPLSGGRSLGKKKVQEGTSE